MQTLWQDLQYGARTLLKNRSFTVVALLALALGIGANTAIFSVVNHVLLRPLTFTNPERLVRVYDVSAKESDTHGPLSYPDFEDFRKQSQSLEHLAAYNLAGATFTAGSGEPERLDGVIVSANLFPMLGATPVLGRVFTSEEDQKGASPVIVLSYDLWQRRFAADPRIVGQQLTIGGRNTTVLGVMPQGFKFPVVSRKVEYWMPFASDPGVASFMERRGSRFLPVLAKFKPGLTLQQAQSEMNIISTRLEAQYPDTNVDTRIQLVPLQEDLVGDIKPALLVLLGAVGFVLLIACANVANLLLARAAARGKEIAIRTALGASRARVVRQLLTESLLLAFVGGILGLLLALWGIDLLVAASPASIPRLTEVRLDGSVLLFTLAISVLTGIIFGIAPALQASKPEMNESLKEGGRGSMQSARRNRVRSLLVVSEVALSLMLLIGAGLLIKSFFQLLQTNPGYDASRVLTLDVSLSRQKYPEPERQANFFQQVIHRIAAVPGVEAVGAINLLPLSGNDRISTFKFEGRPVPPNGEEPDAGDQIATPDYFRAMNIPLRKGRDFTERDTKNSPPVIVVSEIFVRRYFASGEDPLGKRIHIDGEIEHDGDTPPAREIIGVVGDVHHVKLDTASYPTYYRPFLQAPSRRMNLAVRSTLPDPTTIAAAVRNAIKEVDKDQLIWETKTMSEMFAASIAPQRFNVILLGVFALVALILASVGIYGVIAYSVTQRTHEIGVRMALGAQSRDVLKLIVRQGMSLAFVGILVGLLGALALTRVVVSLLYHVSATDPMTFIIVAALLSLVAMLACYIPARRATKVDPMVALRHE